jgi:hypothetical protein
MAQLSREDLYIQGYADDLALMITGKFLSTVSELIQKFLNIVQNSCRAGQLSVSPDKMELVCFPKRKKSG